MATLRTLLNELGKVLCKVGILYQPDFSNGAVLFMDFLGGFARWGP